MSKSELPKIISRQEDGSYTVHDQVIHFVDGHKRYIKGVKYIWENEMLHLVTENENEFIINKDNVLFVQRRLEFKNDSF
uniref:Uncharacterized protein n=1 Tax=viral metagenome TaxID=1070528 RepID=A0A6M3IGB5_9ZZZZ